MQLRDVTLDDVQRLLRLKVEGGLSIQTARHIKNVISAIFSPEGEVPQAKRPAQ